MGPRLLIKFLQDAAGKGDLDPWDIDVISVIDSFLEQYSQSFGSKSNSKISYHKDLAETSEAFFAASVLVNLKAQVLESCLLYTSPSPRDSRKSRMPSSA